MGGKVSFFLQLSGFSLNRETMLFRDLFFFWDTWLQAEYFLFHPILKELWFLSCALYAYDGWYSAADSAVLVTVLLPWLILNTIPDFTSAFLLHSRGKEYSQYLHFCVLRPNKENFQLPFFFFFLPAASSEGCKGQAVSLWKPLEGILRASFSPSSTGLSWNPRLTPCWFLTSEIQY